MQSANLEMLQRIAALPCPIVGIPMPGLRPFSCQRTVLAQLIEGLNGDTRIELTLRGARTPELRVSSDAGRRGFTLLGQDATCHGNRGSVYGRQLAWAKRQREAKGVKASGKPTSLLKLEKALAVQERKLKSYGHSKPSMPDGVLRWTPHWRKVTDANRAQWLAWRAQKAERRKLFGVVLTAYRKVGGRIKDTPKYRALREAGYPVVLYSKLPKHQRDNTPLNVYWRHIYRHVVASTAPRSRGRRWWKRSETAEGRTFVDKPEIGGESSNSLHEVERDRMEYSVKMREWKNDQERVEWLKAQIASYQTDPQGGKGD